MKRSSIISLAALIVVAAALTAVFLLLKNKENKPPAEEQVKYFTVKTVDAAGVDKLVLKSDLYEGVFTKQGEEWFNDQDLLNQSVISQFPDLLLSNLRAMAKIEDPAADAEYGLDKPSAVLEAYKGGERVVKIELGDKVPTKEYYYCRFDDSTAIYTVSDNYARILLRERSYYVSKVSLPNIAGIKNITEVILEGELFPEFHAAKNRENPYDYSGAGVFPWYFTKPYRAQWEADVVGGNWMNQLETYLTIYSEEVRTVYPDEFARYGLTNPAATLTVRYESDSRTEKREYVLEIGNQDPETGNYYAAIKGMNVLLVMKESNVRRMCEVDVFGTTYHALFYPGIREFSKVIVSAGDFTQVFTHETIGGEDVYAIDGVTVSNQEALSWTQMVVSLKTTAFEPSETPNEEPILTIVVEPANPQKLNRIETRIFRGENGTDIVERLGVCDCTMDSRSVDAFIQAISGS